MALGFFILLTYLRCPSVVVTMDDDAENSSEETDKVALRYRIWGF